MGLVCCSGGRGPRVLGVSLPATSCLCTVSQPGLRHVGPPSAGGSGSPCPRRETGKGTAVPAVSSPLPTLPSAVPGQWCWCRGQDLSQPFSPPASHCRWLLRAGAPASCWGIWLSQALRVMVPRALLGPVAAPREKAVLARCLLCCSGGCSLLLPCRSLVRAAPHLPPGGPVGG